MVSKIMKIRENNCVAMKNHHSKRRRHHRRNFSDQKGATTSKVMLASIVTDKGSLEILNPTQTKTPEPEPQTTRPPLPPLTSPEKKTVFLDLDETLVHSSVTLPNRFDFLVRPIIHGTEMRFYVIKRPGVDQFLQKLAEKYEVVVFTAGMREYASLVLDRLDRHDVIISHRLYRDSCKEVNGKLVKDLSGLGRDLRSVVIVDDNPNSYVLQPENGIPVRPFIYDMPDGELRKLLMFFESEGSHEDIRDAVREYVHRDGRISDDDDLNDDDSSASETGDDDELETGNGKFTNVPVLTTSNSSTPCCMINLHDYYPPAKPVATESWIKTVILCILILMIINVILCLLILWKA